jgi:hypothetical protein
LTTLLPAEVLASKAFPTLQAYYRCALASSLPRPPSHSSLPVAIVSSCGESSVNTHPYCIRLLTPNRVGRPSRARSSVWLERPAHMRFRPRRYRSVERPNRSGPTPFQAVWHLLAYVQPRVSAHNQDLPQPQATRMWKIANLWRWYSIRPSLSSLPLHKGHHQISIRIASNF